jgi:hypothetical protein
LTALAEKGYATGNELRRFFRASMVAGVLRALLAFTSLKAMDAAARSFVTGQILAAFRDLLTVVHS